MEEKYMNPGYVPVLPKQPVSPGAANMPVMPNNPSNNASKANRGANLPNMPMAAGVPSSSNGPMPPAMPKANNVPLAAMMPKAQSAMAPANMPKTEKMPNMANPEYIPNMAETEDCTYKSGELPACAPLAAGYVPYQRKNAPKYAAVDALTHGTLFPGLDLPFMNVANKNNPYAGTPLGEIMALGFAIHELSLYLDTHKDDKEAFEMQKTLIALNKEGRKEYEKQYGPIDMMDMEKADHYTWLKDPWPWEYAERTGK